MRILDLRVLQQKVEKHTNTKHTCHKLEKKPKFLALNGFLFT